MSPITHLLIGWAVASSVPTLTKRERACVTWASVVPDMDGLGLVAEVATRNTAHPLTWWTDYHHILGHNIGFALVVVALSALVAKNRVTTAGLVFLSFHLHLLGDLAGARGPDGDQWPIPYLLPFSNAVQAVWSGQWALNAWPNLLLTAALLSFALFLACRRGFSPVELLSSRADSVVIAALRNRFATQARSEPVRTLDP